MRKTLFATLIAAFAALANAQTYMTPMSDLSMMSFAYTSAATSLTQDAYTSDDSQTNSSQDSIPLEIVADRDNVKRVAKNLAAHFPQNLQAEAETMYLTLYNTYEENYPTTFSGAMAAMLVGSYCAYHNRLIPDEHSFAVVKQFDEHLQSNPQILETLSENEREEAYIQMIMTGMQLVASAIKNENTPDNEEILRQKQTGEQHLQTLLQTPAQNVVISAQGFAIR